MPKKVLITGGIGWETTPHQIRQDLEDAKGQNLDIEIASPGGLVFEGIEIFNLIRDYKRKYPKSQILAVIKGLAASMASYLAMNPAIDLLTIEDNASFMIHNASSGAYGDYREMKKTAEILDGLTGILGKAYSAKTKKSEKEIRDMMDAETWFFGDEIVNAGFADEIIKTDAKKDKASAFSESKTQFAMINEKVKSTSIDYEKLVAMVFDFDPKAPYPNEHAARIVEPGEFEQDTFRRKNIATGIDIIIGKLKGESSMTTQAYRFSIDNFTAAEAKKWLKDHDIKYISFEPATNAKNLDEDNKESKNNKEKKSMETLQEFLEKNPAAMKEYNSAIAAAVKQGEDKMKGIIAKVTPIISEEKYKKARPLAMKTLSGETSVETFDAAIAYFDMNIESTNSTAAQEETDKNGNITTQPSGKSNYDRMKESVTEV